MITFFSRLLLPSVLLLASCSKGGGTEAQTVADSLSTSQMVHEIARCSRLYTTEYKIHKIMTIDDEKRLNVNILSQNIQTKLPGERKLALPIEVTFKAYVDFNEFSEAHVRRTDSSLTVILPDPHVMVVSSAIDHDGVRQYVGLTRQAFTDAEMKDLARRGEAEILKEVGSTQILTSARESAVRTLMPLLQRMGYGEKRVTVTFRKEAFTPAEWQKMITVTKD